MASTVRNRKPSEPVELPEREHREGCPATRVEQTETRSPKGRLMRVTRCIDCGGQRTERVGGRTVEPDLEDVHDGTEEDE